eukprot:1135041-Amphidinium_carterae.1
MVSPTGGARLGLVLLAAGARKHQPSVYRAEFLAVVCALEKCQAHEIVSDCKPLNLVRRSDA